MNSDAEGDSHEGELELNSQYIASLLNLEFIVSYLDDTGDYHTPTTRDPAARVLQISTSFNRWV